MQPPHTIATNPPRAEGGVVSATDIKPARLSPLENAHRKFRHPCASSPAHQALFAWRGRAFHAAPCALGIPAINTSAEADAEPHGNCGNSATALCPPCSVHTHHSPRAVDDTGTLPRPPKQASRASALRGSSTRTGTQIAVFQLNLNCRRHTQTLLYSPSFATCFLPGTSRDLHAHGLSSI